MKTVLIGLMACFSLTVAASNSLDCSPAFYKKTGGRLVKPGSKHGFVAFVNATEKFAQKDVESIAAYLQENTRLEFRAIKDVTAKDPADALAGTKANAVILIVEDAASPKVLIAPEDHWAVLNVAKLQEGLPKGEAVRAKMLSYRLRKALNRTAAQLLGAGQSMFRGNLMAIASIEEADGVQEELPADTLGAITDYLGKIGVTPEVIVTYGRACREGWAPAPTNDVQKAIWDKVHAIPQNPMKIEFDPKKGR